MSLVLNVSVCLVALCSLMMTGLLLWVVIHHPKPPNVLERDLLERAWGIISNVSEGDWGKQTNEWREVACVWRKKVEPYLRA